MSKKLQKVKARFHLLTAQTPNKTLGISDGSYSILSIDGESSINDAYSYNIRFVSDDALPIQSIADTDAQITLQDENSPLRKRKIFGKIYKIEESSTLAKKHLYTATVVSPFFYLGLNRRYKVYQKMSALEIITEIISSSAHILNLEIDNKLDAANYPKRETCTQYNQSDAEFIIMLAQEEKFSINFDSKTHESYKMILSNMNEHAQASDEILMGSFNRSKAFTPTSQTENFYDFESPSHDYLTEDGQSISNLSLEDNNISAQLRSELKVQTIRDRLELMDGARAKDLSRYTKLNATSDYASSETISGNSESLYTDDSLLVELFEKQTKKTIKAVLTSTRLSANFPNALDEYVDETAQYSFNVSFTAIPSQTLFISAEPVIKPSISGIQTAIVSSGSPDTPSGENTIEVDEMGRIKVIFHFDNAKPTSAYVRLGTMFSGNNWGAQFLPRVNTEVIVSFINGNIDKPVIIGAVYNGNNSMPQGLPDSKTQSYIKTRSMPGDGYNELLFEDKGEEELLSLRAQKDYKLHALHDSAINIDNDQVEEIGNDETITIGNDRVEEVKHDETMTVGNDRTESVGNDETINIGNNQSETIGNNRTTSIGSNDTRTVGSNDSLRVGSNRSANVSGNDTTMVLQNSAETIAIAKALTVGAAYQISVGGAKNETVGMTSTEQVGLLKHIIAGKRFEVSVGGSSLILNTDGTIILKGKEIKLEGSKQVTVNGKMVEVN
ncbi:type VI secretion system tip protein VgrG [Sulfurimonas sp. MAG313]|nr:type VI secretion system tip protein TssI/VgrG [Sulfurimonas sp. MAG313]MDF1880495.1 type VI secretion system tip protein VgrG [Sulfurimonas sp. MAG313]